MPLPEGLLNPIPGNNPCGKNLRYDPVYDKIREARREEEILPQGDWSREVKKADYPLVIKLTIEALTLKTKDLQLAAWLTESILNRDHVQGLREGLDLLRALIETYWDTLYPEIEDGELEYRAGPLAWVGAKLDGAVRCLPLTKNKLDFYKYQESRRIGYEVECSGNEAKTAARAAAIEEKRCTAEEFDEAVRATGEAFYQNLSGNLVGALESVQSLEAISDNKFERDAPSFANLRAALEDLQEVVRHYHPIVSTETEETIETKSSAEYTQQAPEGSARSQPRAAKSSSISAELQDRDDAVQRLLTVTSFLRRENPRNPVPYLLLRAMRWGEVRHAGTQLNPEILEPPASEIRTQLRKNATEGNWQEVLEIVETAMSLPCGRGWIDLQRYAVRACESLGSEFDAVAAAIRSELRAMLVDYPDLVNSSLLDDTAAANAETQAWLQENILPRQTGPEPQTEPEFAPALATVPGSPTSVNGEPSADVLEIAMKAARSGRVQEAIEMLCKEIGQERSGRGRFQRQIQLAGIFLATKHESIAYPILLELMEEIDRRKLETWEEACFVAQPVALLYRCAETLARDDSEKQRIYQKLCRLDPAQALASLR